MKKTLQDIIIEKLEGAKFVNGMDLKNEVHKFFKELVEESEYEERMERCKEDAEEFLESAKDLFESMKSNLFNEIDGEYNNEEIECSLQNLFTQSSEFEKLAHRYKGFNCLYYYQQNMILEEPDFYNDINIQIVNEKKYLISTDFNYLEVYIEIEDADENGYVIIKDVSTERLS